MNALAVAWVVVLVWGAVLVRPRTGALRRLEAVHRGPPRRRPMPVSRLGRMLRSVAGRPADAAADRRVGVIALAALAGAAVDVVAGLAAAALSWFILRRRARRRGLRRRAEVLDQLPETLDLFALAASAGLSVRLAVETVAPRLGGPVGRALNRAVAQMNLGVDASEALEALTASPEGEPLRMLVRPLTESLHYGSALGPALQRAAAVARGERRRLGEAAARRVPLRLLFPLTLCVLPAFVLLTIVPTVAQSLDLLRF